MHRYAVLLCFAACTPTTATSALLGATDCGTKTLCTPPGKATAQCTDLDNDGANCGACGHDCQGNACSAGFCPVQVLSQGTTRSVPLVADSDNLYWADNGQIVKIEKLAAGPEQVVVSGGVAPDPKFLATDGVTIFYADDHGVLTSAALAGGAAQALSTGSFPVTGGIAVDEASVYWASGAAVVSVPKAGGATTTVAGGFITPWSLVVDSQNIYLTDRGSISAEGTPIGDNSASVQAISKTGDTLSVLTAGLADASQLAENSTALFVAAPSLQSIPLAGGAPTLVLQQRTSGIALDGTTYFAASGAQITTRATSDANPFPIYKADDTSAIYGLVVDAGSVYASVNTTAGTQIVKITR